MPSPFRVACSLLAILAAALPVAADEQKVPPQPEEVRIAIEGADLVVQGTKVSLPCQLEELVRLLGPGDRVSKLHNWITTWDRLGVIAYCKPETTQVISVGFAFARKTFKFSPQTLFAGRLTLDGAPINTTSSLGNINAAKKGEKLAELVKDLPWGIRYPEHLVTVGTEKDATGAGVGIDQVAVSCRTPKKPND
jgi:hypothetical protein